MGTESTKLVRGLLVLALLNGDSFVCGKSLMFYCYGDICNSGSDDQFCSSAFRLCRNCADIQDDCGERAQPNNCTSYCTDYLANTRLQKEKDRECTNLPVVSNGEIYVTHATQQKMYKQSDVAKITCKHGYQLVYSSIMYCGQYGVFQNSIPKCEAMECTFPPEIPNAKLTSQTTNKRFKPGSHVSYKCNDGYFLLCGSQTVTCTQDGSWNSPNEPYPVCLQDKYKTNEVAMFLTIGMACLELALITVLVILLIKQRPSDCSKYRRTEMRNYDSRNCHTGDLSKKRDACSDLQTLLKHNPNTNLLPATTNDNCRREISKSVSHDSTAIGRRETSFKTVKLPNLILSENVAELSETNKLNNYMNNSIKRTGNIGIGNNASENHHGLPQLRDIGLDMNSTYSD